MKKYKNTLTIGIPAYNEVKNIGSLLRSVESQTISSAKIERVIVYSDASTDGTLEVVNKTKIANLEIISGKKRMGKSYAMNEIIGKTKSDILVLLDADILIRDQHMIEKLIEPILKQDADLASARVKEYWAKSKFEEILKISMNLKKEIFESINSGNNIYTCHGRARAMSKRLYKSIRFKKNVVAEDAYTYLYTVYNHFKYIFAQKSNVYYRLPGTFKDHQKQSVRFIQSYKQLVGEFGKSFISKETNLPKHIAIPYVFKYFLRYPFTLTMYLGILIFMKIRSVFVNEMRGTWVIAESTKEGFRK